MKTSSLTNSILECKSPCLILLILHFAVIIYYLVRLFGSVGAAALALELAVKIHEATLFFYED